MKKLVKLIKILFAKMTKSYCVIDDKPTGTLFRLNKETLEALKEPIQKCSPYKYGEFYDK